MEPLETAAEVATISTFLLELIQFAVRGRRWWRHRTRAKQRRRGRLLNRPRTKKASPTTR